MLSTLRRWLATAPTDAETGFLTECVRQLEADVTALQQAELRRSAEHAAMIDQLDRLYKRVSARIAREGTVEAETPASQGESLYELRKRLGR